MPTSMQDAFQPAEPVMVEAQGRPQVDSLLLLEGATLRVCYEGMLDTDFITMRWETAPGEFAPIDPQYGMEAGCVDFHIAPYYVGLRLDNYAAFFCIVTRDGKDYPSERARVRINAPSNLPAPTLKEASNDTLDLSRLCCRDPFALVERWAFIDKHHTVTLDGSGTKHDGTRFFYRFFEDDALNDNDLPGGWSRALPLAVLRELKHASRLTLVCFVKFHGTSSGHSVMFPTRTLTVLTEPHLELSAPTMKEAVHTEFDGWLVNPVNTVNGAHIVVTYEGMCSGDTVCATLSGTPGPGTPLLECRQPEEGQGSIVFAVAPSVIGANIERQIKLEHSVTRCDGSRWYSPGRVVKVLGLTGLPAPNIEEATGDVLDFNTFSGDATAAVPIWDYAAEGQCCWMGVSGVLEDGSAFRLEVLTAEPLTAEGLVNGVVASISRAELQRVADCSDVEVHFAVSFDGRCDRESAIEFPVKTFNVVHEKLLLAAPSVLEAVGTDLTICNGRNGVTVRVADKRISGHHLVGVTCERADGSQLNLPAQPGNSAGCVDVGLDRDEVIKGAGKTLRISFSVTNGCQLAWSETLELKISVPVHNPTPVVPQATPHGAQECILDMATFSGDACIIVPRWWWAQENQPVWVKCTGTKKDGSRYVFYVVRAARLTLQEVSTGLAKTLSRSELALLKHDTALYVACIVAPDEREHEADGIAFPVLKLMVRQPLVCEEEKFETQRLNTFAVGGHFETPVMRVTFKEGSGTAGIVQFGNDAYYSGNHFVLCENSGFQDPPQVHLFEFTHALESVKFGWSWKQEAATVTYYDEAGLVLDSVSYPDARRGGFWVEYKAPSGQTIKSMIVLVRDYSFIDNFTLCYRE